MPQQEATRITSGGSIPYVAGSQQIATLIFELRSTD